MGMSIQNIERCTLDSSLSLSLRKKVNDFAYIYFFRFSCNRARIHLFQKSAVYILLNSQEYTCKPVGCPSYIRMNEYTGSELDSNSSAIDPLNVSSTMSANEHKPLAINVKFPGLLEEE